MGAFRYSLCNTENAGRFQAATQLVGLLFKVDWDRLSNAPRPVVTLCLRSPVAGNVDDDKEIDEIYTLLTEN